VFQWFGMSINTMTLGGLAVAIGELVDDAIVDVENIFRRLKQNRHVQHPKPPLQVVYEASSEVRNSIVFSTFLVVLVFVPLFALGGMEGRLFTPLAVAYIVSIVASLKVSLTVTPVLAYWLLGRDTLKGPVPFSLTQKSVQSPAGQSGQSPDDRDAFLLRGLKWLAGYAIRFSIRHPWPILAVVAGCVAISCLAVTRLGTDFLPPFNE
jgi:Cu/Ag efflux pump CusA